MVVMNPEGLAPADDWESLADLEARGAQHLDAMRTERADRLSKIKRDDREGSSSEIVTKSIAYSAISFRPDAARAWFTRSLMRSMSGLAAA